MNTCLNPFGVKLTICVKKYEVANNKCMGLYENLTLIETMSLKSLQLENAAKD